MSGSEHGFSTRAIHAGQEPDPATGATIVPIYATSTYTQAGPGEHKGYEYSRSGNPTRTALEACLASLEGGERGLAFASGLAATTAVLSLLKPGDEVVAAADLYGGTYRLLERVFKPWGLVARYTDDPSPAGFDRLVTKATKLVWIETPTNPLLQILDIAAIATIAHRAGALLAVDNTFASPYLQQPLKLGADLVVHSATKYLGGHSDVLLGAVVAGSAEGAERLRAFRGRTGIVAAPDPCWLLLRSLKTLRVRMERITATAQALVEKLSAHPAVETVRYPGFSGLLSFDVPDPRKVETSLRVITNATSLGGTESLLESRARWEGDRVPPGLLRLSVGLEDPDELWADLEQALA